ncbi:MAG: hypothetical protein E7584_05825 [Ruminococcaceae bacterium]|nr:hypothetical protein [Oscillospiraceae bacterium]
MATKYQDIIYSVDDAHKARFDRLCREAASAPRGSGDEGIGTLGEKRMHAIIKRYICEDHACHEVGLLDTGYVSDVRIGNDVYEVQTGAFYPMKKKIAHYIENTDCTVTVVHPISVERFVTWVDSKTGDMTPRKRSPKRERAIHLLPELYCLLPHLGNQRLRFRLLMIEEEDFRTLTGRKENRKRGARLYERMPLSLLGEIEFSSPVDFAVFLPPDLPSPFTVKDFAQRTGLRGRDAYSAVHVLEKLGLITKAEPIGRAMAFRI